MLIQDIDTIYIFSLFIDTGGPKTLHQLALELVKRNYCVKIVYFYNGKIIHSEKLLYDWCLAEVDNDVVDKEKNLIIIPEVATNFLKQFPKANKVIWWLSLDFYLRNNIKYWTKVKLHLWGLPIVCYPMAYIYFWFKIKDKVNEDEKKYNDYYNFYNCEYIAEYLKTHGVKANKLFYLCGPVEEDYVNNCNAYAISKENMVAFNFSKAKVNRRFVRKIIKSINKKRNDISVVKIEKMTKQQVIDTLRICKVYVDLGLFPGPERLPREAVTTDTAILVAQKGSARNQIDYPIPEKYKVDISHIKMEDIADAVIDVVNNYDECVSDFAEMKNKVLAQRNLFETSIDSLFGKL
jgi:hypothetical protein